MGRTLRIAILGLRVQEAKRYHVSFQALGPGQAPAGVVVASDPAALLQPDQVARTETCEPSSKPEFLNRVFILRLPEPISSTASHGRSSILHCNLFSSPSLDNVPGLSGGQGGNQLQGSASVRLQGELTGRLALGERVTLPVMLNSAGQQGSSNMSQTNLMASMYGLRPGLEVLLELQLLDAVVPLASDLGNLSATFNPTGTSASTAGAAGSTLGSTGTGPGLPGADAARLLVLVSHAMNLPTLRGQDGREAAPSTFVTVRSQRDVHNSVPSQAATKVAANTTQPVWGQMLQVRYPEQDIDSEQLHLSIVNDQDARLQLSCALPLAALQPRRHTCLEIKMPGGPLGSQVSLFVTLCLMDCPNKEAKFMQMLAKSGVSHVTALSVPVAASQVLTSTAPASEPGSQVVATWTLLPPTSATAGNEQASSQPGTGMHQDQADPGSQPAASLQTDQIYHVIDTTQRGGVMQQLERVVEHAQQEALSGQRCQEVLPLKVFTRGEGSHDKTIWDTKHDVILLQSRDLPDLSSTPDQRDQRRIRLDVHLIQPGNNQTTPLASVTIPADKAAKLSGMHQSLNELTITTTQGDGGACNLEAARWTCEAYIEHLNKSRSGSADSSHLGDSLPRSILDGMSWQTSGDGPGGTGTISTHAASAVLDVLVGDVILKQVALERLSRAADSAIAHADNMRLRLADLQHQNNNLQQDLQTARSLLHEERDPGPANIMENAANMSKAEVVERAEVAIAAAARERRRNTELVHRLQQLHGEQVDVLEMKKRYQELQAAHMEVSQLLANDRSKLENPYRKQLDQHRATVKTQEQVISQLERLLAQAASQAKQVPALQQQLKDVQSRLHAKDKQPRDAHDKVYKKEESTMLETQQQLLKQQQEWLQQQQQRQLDMMRQQGSGRRSRSPEVQPRPVLTDEIAAELTVLRQANQEALQENMQLKLELKRAEDRTAAARDELVAVIKRYAAEIADLKWRLAEKDAQLMGGFGSPARLLDMDDDLGLPKVHPWAFTGGVKPPSPQQQQQSFQSRASVGNSVQRQAPGNHASLPHQNDAVGAPRVNSADQIAGGLRLGSNTRGSPAASRGVASAGNSAPGSPVIHSSRVAAGPQGSGSYNGQATPTSRPASHDSLLGSRPSLQQRLSNAIAAGALANAGAAGAGVASPTQGSRPGHFQEAGSQSPSAKQGLQRQISAGMAQSRLSPSDTTAQANSPGVASRINAQR